ncbi:MAG: hypothetical protein NDF53_00450 [archaeon GB-1867-097]|nr:hypothetical protein [Candidatus Culexmicrobium thermophilum]MCS7384203.1 hypothetical protein [Candidatus Culexmicrobium thermophilum]HDO20350.1 hypothetical protein [Candidatus Bathyarchaeota archaeon]
MLTGDPLSNDLVVGLIVAVPILLAVTLTKKIGGGYCWVNRKIIHFSTIPAVYAYLYIFNDIYIWTIFALGFVLYTLIPHLKNREKDWFQVKGNFGEVYYCLIYLIVGSVFFYINRPLAAVAMLLTAIGDGITGIIRFFLFKRKEEAISLYVSTDPNVRKACKTIAGTLGFLAVGIPLTAFFFGVLKGVIITLISAIAEKQHLLDDNLAIPATVLITYYIMLPFQF